MYSTGLAPERNATSSVLCRQETGTPQSRRNRLDTCFRMGMARIEHDKGWQILIHACQAVGNQAPIQGLPQSCFPLKKVIAGFVIDSFGVHGSDDRQLIHPFWTYRATIRGPTRHSRPCC
jgi:hypothetical protein